MNNGIYVSWRRHCPSLHFSTNRIGPSWPVFTRPRRRRAPESDRHKLKLVVVIHSRSNAAGCQGLVRRSSTNEDPIHDQYPCWLKLAFVECVFQHRAVNCTGSDPIEIIIPRRRLVWLVCRSAPWAYCYNKSRHPPLTASLIGANPCQNWIEFYFCLKSKVALGPYLWPRYQV